MRKFKAICAFMIGVTLTCLLLTNVTKAQTNAATQMTPALDTITNVDTSYLILRLPGAKNILTAQLDVTKISGTTAGSATLQGSLTGVASSYNDIKGADTLTLTNVSRSYHWVQPRSNFLYYRIRTLSTGTHSTQLKGFILNRE